MKEGGRNWIFNASRMVALLPCLALLSCSDDLASGTQGVTGSICFGISSDEDGAASRSGGDSTYDATHLVLRSDETADTLCLTATITDGISSLGSDQTLTRSTPVTSSAFFDQFHVVAYWKENDELKNSFFLNQTATDDGSNTWTTKRTYYWPGSGNDLRFLAWAPTDCDGLVTPSSTSSTDMTYTVPATATDQKDVVVALTDYLVGDYNEAVPLTFNHICSAIRLEVGSEIQEGTINSVTFSGVYDTGTYSADASTWTLGNTTSSFSESLGVATTGYESEGDEITPEASTFMMLPQTLPDGATIEVSFTNAWGTTSTLSASLAGTEWPMGKTITYKLSISPDYDLEFVTSPTAQDAHYEVYPITIKAIDLPAGWTLTSNDNENVTFVEKSTLVSDIQDLIDDGYWLKDYCGSSSLTSTTSGDNIEVYVFLKENASDAGRDITLTLTASGTSKSSATFSFTQLCPAWNNGIGVERLQEEDYPWGFKWGSDDKITYTIYSGYLVSPILRAIYGLVYSSASHVSFSYNLFRNYWTTSIDLSEVSALSDDATSDNNGLANTWYLYNYDGLGEVSTLISQLESLGGTVTSGSVLSNTDYAALECAKKNPFTISTEEEDGYTVYAPTLSQSDMVWYLPAKDEAPNMNDDTYPLSGDYWTSTAITTGDDDTAYKVTFSGGTTSEEDRNSSLHVRAVRKQTN